MEDIVKKEDFHIVEVGDSDKAKENVSENIIKVEEKILHPIFDQIFDGVFGHTSSSKH